MKKVIILFLFATILFASCQKEQTNYCNSVTQSLEITDFRRVEIATDSKSATIWFNMRKYVTNSEEVTGKIKLRVSEGVPFIIDTFKDQIEDARIY